MRKGMIMQPGSFNPLHRMHKKIADDAIARFPSYFHAFILSSKTCDKGIIPMDELQRRKFAIKKEGYNVFISESGLFIDHITKIRAQETCIISKNDVRPEPASIVFAVGEDTVYRFFRDWENFYRNNGKDHWKKYMDYERMFKNVTWYVTKRETETIKFKNLANKYFSRYDNIIWSPLDLDDISSTKIREGNVSEIK